MNRTSKERSPLDHLALEKIIECLPGIITLTDHKSGEVFFYNRRSMEMLGFDVDKIVRMSFSERLQMIFPEDLQEVKNYYSRFDELTDDEENRVEYRIRNKKKEMVWLDVRGRVFRRDEKGAVVETLHIAMDLTKHKKAKENIKAQAHFLKAISDVNPDMISVINLETHEIEFANSRSFEAHGFGSITDPFEKRKACNRRSAIHPEDRQAAVNYFKKFMDIEDEEVLTLEYRAENDRGELNWHRSQGRIFRRDDNGIPTHAINIVHTICEQKKTELLIREKNEELRKSEEKWLTLVHNTPDPIARFDRELRFVFANRTFLGNMGIAEADLIGKTNVEIGTPQDVNQKWVRMLLNVFETGKPGEMTSSYPLGDEIIYMTTKVVPEFADDGSVSTVLAIGRDITEIKKSQSEILRLKDEIASKTEEKYLSLFNSIDEGFALGELIRDENGVSVDYRILELNPAFERYTGFNASTLVGKRIYEVYPELGNWRLQTYSRVVESGNAVHFEQKFEPYNRWYSASAYPRDNDRFMLIYNDITERKRREQQQEFLLLLSDTIRSLSDPEDIEGTATKIALDNFGTDRCYFGSIEENVAVVTRDASTENLPSLAGSYVLDNFPLFKKVVEGDGLLIVEDVSSFDRIDERSRTLCNAMGIVSIMGVPVVKNGKTVSFLAFANSFARKWTEAEVQLAREAAERTWAAIERAKVEEALRLSEKSLKELNENLEQQIQKRTKQLTKLKVDQEKEKLNAIIFTQEEERARISESLHDSLAQLLYAIQNKLQEIKPVGEINTRSLHAASEILAEAIQESRKISHELMPPVLKDYGLKECLKILAERLTSDKLRLNLDVNIIGRLPEKLEITIYRIVQEILNNILKHANAAEAELKIKVFDKYILVDAGDDGVGFDVKLLKNPKHAIGLKSVENRVKLLGGKIKISSKLNKGTQIHLQIPFTDK